MNDVTTWRYHFPNENHEGWAIFFLDSIGCLSVLSDWGNYAHRWSQGGWHSKDSPYDFRIFILQAGDDYILNKITQGQDVYQEDETIASIKKEIIELRRSYAEWDRHRARKEWDLLMDSDLSTSEGFTLWCPSSSLEEPWNHHCRGPAKQAVMFMKRVMPRLRAKLRQDLEAEGLIEPLAAGPECRP